MSGNLRVGVDGKCLTPPRAGVGRYLAEVLGSCSRLGDTGLDLAVISPSERRRTMPWVLWSLQRATAGGFDVFHFPFYYPPLRPRCPATVAIHDILAIEHPEWFPHGRINTLRLLIPMGARRAAAIVTGSRSVAEGIAERCRVPMARIHLTGYGVNRRLFAPPGPERVESARARLGLVRPYVLQLGAMEPRRGADLALAAVGQLRTVHPDLELAVVGEARAEVQALRQPRPWLRLLGRLEDDLLPSVYAGAIAVLAPSRGEGFDLPVLEALACGAPVVASDIAVHREHFAPAVALFESGNVEALVAALSCVIDDSEAADRLRAAGPSLAANFSWDDVARRHIGVWREVGEG